MRRSRKKIQIEDLSIALLRVVKRVESLEAHVGTLEDELEARKAELNIETSGNASELFQKGIDSIMGFQWPPIKGGTE